MAYQLLNIIGSFTAGPAAAQRELSVDRERVEAYRALLRSQVQREEIPEPKLVANVETQDKMVIGDAPHDRRNPYLFVRGPKAEPAEAAPSPSNAEPPGDHLDIVV